VAAGDIVMAMYETEEGYAMVKHGELMGLIPRDVLTRGGDTGGGRGGDAFGIDREIALRAAANYNRMADAKAQWWLEQLLGEELPEPEAGEGKTLWKLGGALKDGTRLCQILNVINGAGGEEKSSKAVTFHDLSGLKGGGVARQFKEKENIHFFLKGARDMGVIAADCFETADLHEFKAPAVVLQTIFAVSRAALSNVSTFKVIMTERCLESGVCALAL
jgi:hypothetical protein